MNKNNINNIFITKFKIDGYILYAQVFWKPNEHDLFQIKIYDNNTTWTGRFSNEFAESFSKCTLEYDQYKLNLKNALAGDHEAYSYTLKPDEGDKNTNTFKWFKIIDTATMLHGCVPLHRNESSESKDGLLDIMLLQNKDLRSSIDLLNKRNDQINEDLNRCKTELETFVNMKTSLETSLYGKFVQLLNTKKRRIQLLEENLHKYEEPYKSLCDNDLD